MAVQLAPVQHPLGIWNQYLARQSETLILREKVMSLSGDSFDITMANGEPIFKICQKHSTLEFCGIEGVATA